MAEEWKPGKKFVDPTKLSRKVFDKHVDRIELHRKRDRDDHRADIQALFQRITNLENQLSQVVEQLDMNLLHANGECSTACTSCSEGLE